MIVFVFYGVLFTCKSVRMYIILICIIYQFALKVIVASALQTSGSFSYSLFFSESARDNFAEVAFSFFGRKLRNFRSAHSFSVFESLFRYVVSLNHIRLSVFYFFAIQISVDAGCCLFSISYSFDGDRNLVVTAVSACKYSRHAGHKCFRIVSYGILSCLVAVKHGSVYSLADGKNHSVYSYSLCLSFYRDRSSSAGSIRFSQFHNLKNNFFYVTVFVFYYFQWISQILEDNAFFFSFFDFYHVSRHFVFSSSVDIVNFLSAQPYCSSACVHSGVSASDDGNFLAHADFFISYYSSQEVNSSDNAFSVFAFASHACGYPCAYAQKNSVIIVSYGFERNINAYFCIGYDIYSHAFYSSDFFVQYSFWQSVFRDTVSKHTAGIRHGFEDGYCMAHLSEEVSS